MFNNLIESKPKKDRTVGGMLWSVVLHTALIGGGVAATLHAGERVKEMARQEDVKFIDIPKKEPPPPPPDKAPPPPDVVAAPPPPKGFQVLTAPINIPDKIPDVDLSKSVTDEADFSGKGVAGGTSKGVVGGTAPVNQEQTYFEFQVEKPAMAKESNPPPRYPDILRSGNVEGEVLGQFTVDTLGRAEPGSFKVLKSTNELFSTSVRNVLGSLRFYPAETGGRKVRMIVQQPF
ncbi:MAG: energy transducer TonB, partial [Gemmatimonadaceae bacterium]